MSSAFPKGAKLMRIASGYSNATGLTQDESGDIYFTYTISSSSMFATMQSGGTSLPFSGSFAAFNNFGGDTTYQCTFCKNKDGSLRPGPIWAFGGNTMPGGSAIVLGDFDRDGRADVAVAHGATRTISIERGVPCGP